MGGETPGYSEPEDIATLRFEGTKYDGAEVRVLLSAPLSVYLEIDRTLPLELYKPFAKVLVGWNLRDRKGRPLPATEDGLTQIAPTFLNRMVVEWTRALTEVSVPLVSESSNGDLDVPPSPKS